MTKTASLALATVIASYWHDPARAIELSPTLDLEVTLSALSDYRDTGISQTRGDPAVQGEAILQHDSGLYVGAFMSNIDSGGSARREDMYFVGLTLPLAEQVAIDTYLGRYEYRKDAYSDNNEFFVELSAYGFQLGYTYAFDYRGHIPNNSNIYLAYNLELPWETVLHARYGYSDANTEVFWSASEEARHSYHDWEVKLSKEVAGINLFASYIDTDLSSAECASAFGFDDVCSATVVVGVSKTF